MQHRFGIVGVEHVTITMVNDEADMAEVMGRCQEQDNMADGNIERNSRNVAMSRIRFAEAPRYFPVE